jgi:hypothetical protein
MFIQQRDNIAFYQLIFPYMLFWNLKKVYAFDSHVMNGLEYVIWLGLEGHLVVFFRTQVNL